MSPSPTSPLPNEVKRASFCSLRWRDITRPWNINVSSCWGRWMEEPHACLNKKVFKPSSRSPSQGSMRLKTEGELGLVNLMDRQESLKAPRGEAIMQNRVRASNLRPVSQPSKTKNTRGEAPDCFLRSFPRAAMMDSGILTVNMFE